MAPDIDDPLVVCAGILVSDLFVPPLPEIPRPGQIVSMEPPLYQSGGCAANTGIDLASLGVRVRVSGRVGSDALGQEIIDELAASGVDTAGIVRSTTSTTSQTVVLSVIGDDRRFMHCIGANAEYVAAEIDAAAKGASILVIGGFLVLPRIESAELTKVIDRARAAGTRVLLDVVVPLGQGGVADQVKPLLTHIDGFLPNEDEAAVITGESDPIAQAKTLVAWGCPWVAITCGTEGAIYADSTQTIQVEPLAIDYVDGSGAGDAFTAGIVIGMLRQWPIEDTLRYAAALGASVCRGLGCHSTLFAEGEARDHMARVGLHRLQERQ
jgi:sugar/nucleoside kinase (ribokinase family)